MVSINRAGGGPEPFSRGFRGWNPLRKFLCSKEHLDWLEIDLSKARIRTVQYINAPKINMNESTHYKVLKLRVKQVTYESNI